VRGPDLLAEVVRALLESSVLITLALLLERFLLVRRRAVLRHVLWLAVAARLLVPPGATWTTGGVLAPVGAWSAASAGAARQASGALLAASSAVGVLLAAWALGALLLLVRQVLVARRARDACRATSRRAPAAWQAEAAAIAVRLGLRRVPTLRAADDLPCAFVLGAVRPWVVLPAGSDHATRRAALWHELAHVRRRDLLVQTALCVLHALWWPHPLMGLLRRRAAAAREIACDATVARTLGPEVPVYRQALLQAAAVRWGVAGALPVGASPWWRSRAGVLDRLEVLAHPPGRALRALRPVLGSALVVVVVLVALVVLPAAAGGWWSDPQAAWAEASHWTERRPGLGCAPGRHVFLRAVALSAPGTSEVPDR
jgi:beta-lactamase regulating signal transducer with metallopeptidase domain